MHAFLSSFSTSRRCSRNLSRYRRTLFIQLIYSVVFHVTRHQPIAWLHLSVYKPRTTHNSSIRSDEGLTLETSAFESLYGGQFTLSTQLIKPNILVIVPPTQHHSFCRNLSPLLLGSKQRGEQSACRTRNPAVPGSSPALTWICFLLAPSSNPRPRL